VQEIMLQDRNHGGLDLIESNFQLALDVTHCCIVVAVSAYMLVKISRPMCNLRISGVSKLLPLLQGLKRIYELLELHPNSRLVVKKLS
jgi:hypothetical protein